MTNPIPSEAEIEAAENAAKQALAAVEQLRKQREAAEKAATDKAALMAACETAIDAGLFELIGGQLIYKRAARGLSDEEKIIMARARGGHLEVVELAGTMVVLDKALGDVSKGSQDPKLTDQEQLVLGWLRSGRLRLTVIEGEQYVLDRTLSRQRAEARRRKEAARTAASTQEPTQSTVAAPDPAPSGPQSSVVVEPHSEPSGPRRHTARGSRPFGPPSQVTGGPAPTWGQDSSYAPPPDYSDQSLTGDLFGGDSVGTPPASERAWDPRPRQDDEANRKSPGWFSRNILGDRR